MMDRLDRYVKQTDVSYRVTPQPLYKYTEISSLLLSPSYHFSIYRDLQAHDRFSLYLKLKHLSFP